ncbi:polysulfide reductase chain A [Candidatus Thiodiazotropha sp. LNASS1]|uniref:polysulfide reductase chain A n=1 Tax=Candidatus Thiodiazotropha sp. LNASS1 TaxID=3096260 RepID=UPI000D345B7E|nr:polysulfide reductase chain A [Candidatus Thiodiazotropha sp. (ex. Lucinisca nassula)]PUB82891.1 MAG: polysulfide reductase chain A [gamma proteobacterium symbiont of Ctena orbiculata]PUB89877.1 MAG: polysulfide reductase chain A [gamma proteobacterium symbiont of Ctena orbiculata]
MRFPQLKIGQQFEYQGKQYTKTGPLTASEEGTGASAMIRRSAEVTLIDGAVSGALKQQVKQSYSREEVNELCKGYRTRIIQESQKIADVNGTLQLEQLLVLIKDNDMFESIL